MFPDLSHRDRRPELMDDPAIDPEDHRRALKGLARLNRAAMIVGTVEKHLRECCGDGPLSVLDLAAGSGDLVVPLAARAKRAGRPWTFAARDISPTARDAIDRRAGEAGVRIDTGLCDVLEGPIPGGHDVVMCHLFLHHLDGPDIERLLAGMLAAARRGVLITDLSRDRRGYALAWLASRVLTRSQVVHTDSLLSVRAALTEEELTSHASRAGMGAACIRTVMPRRMVLWCVA